VGSSGRQLDKSQPWTLGAGCVLALICCLHAGCGGAISPTTAKQEGSLFKKLVLNYIEIVRRNQGRLPKNNETLSKEFDRVFHDYLAEKNMTVEQLLTSPRDGQPYVFMTQEILPTGKSRIAGYEQVGVNGVRYVGLMSGDVLEVDETGFRDLVPKR
jgi:hypothetical protein